MKFQNTDTIEELNFIISNSKIAFTKLKQIFFLISIFEYFNLKYYI